MPVTISTNQRYNKTVLIDLNSFYTVQPNAPFQITDIAAIQNMIKNIIFTSPGEIAFEPEFGSGIAASLFNPATPTNANILLGDAYFSIQKWLPWVTLNVQQSSVQIDSTQGIYYFTLVYTIAGLPGSYYANLTLSTQQ